MQNEIMTSAQNVALSGRSVDEITADIRVNYRNAKASIVAIGRDLAEVKQMLNHGEWLPYLQGLNISVSSAETICAMQQKCRATISLPPCPTRQQSP